MAPGVGTAPAPVALPTTGKEPVPRPRAPELRDISPAPDRPAPTYRRGARKQNHFRPSAQALHAWDVDRLVALTAGLPVEQVPLVGIGELDQAYWFGPGSAPTVRAVVEHLRLVEEADLAYPIVLDPDGGVMDGMHRVAKALLAGHVSIAARRLMVLPDPDHSDVQPEDLSYD